LINISVLSSLKEKIKDAIATIFFASIPRIRTLGNKKNFGVNLIGYAQAEMGLGEILRSTARSLIGADIPFMVRKLNIKLQNRQNNESLQEFVSNSCRYSINCIGINPDLAYRIPIWLNYSEWGIRYNVGYWFWELENFPREWEYACKIMDEVWVNTDFVHNAVSKKHPKVFKIPFSVEFDSPNPTLDRAYFNLPSSKFLYIFSYDFNSSAARKNPQAVVKAFKKAFSDIKEDVGLVIKSVNAKLDPKLNRVKQELKNDDRIFWMDEYLTTDEMRGLLSVCDCYVSLHRSEGLGLTIAESMYMGKPVIATAYSGNMEFMNAKNSFLVPYKMIKVQPQEYLHGDGQFWADANQDCAVKIMRDVFENSALRDEIGKNAASYMRANHSIAVASKALKIRLTDIRSRISKINIDANF
jgi:glycosyltransferase involved in cell wall biosynthesis